MTARVRVLFLSWHCRNGTAEGLVSARLAEALARRGHEVTLLTTTAPELEGVEVHRVEPDPPGAFDRLSRTMDRWGRIGAVPHLLRGCTVEEAGWVRAVARKASELGPFDVLHSRLNPASSHLAALAVLDRNDLPWCAYFSDPWPHHLYPEPYRFTVGPLSRRRQERSLDEMLRKAGSLVFPSGRLRDWLLAGPRERFRSKAFVAPHPGTAGLERFLSRHPDAPIRVEFAGRYAGAAPEAPPSLSKVVSFHPSMPPEAVQSWMAEADVALLVEANLEEGVFFPSKLSDYLAGDRPILALSPRRGVAADFLSQGGGLLAGPGDEAGIAEALERLYSLWSAGRLAELAPRPEQAAAVSEAAVVPIYERAFQEAAR